MVLLAPDSLQQMKWHVTYLHIGFSFLPVTLGNPFWTGYLWSPPPPALQRRSHGATALKQQIQGPSLTSCGLPWGPWKWQYGPTFPPSQLEAGLMATSFLWLHSPTLATRATGGHAFGAQISYRNFTTATCFFDNNNVTFISVRKVHWMLAWLTRKYYFLVVEPIPVITWTSAALGRLHRGQQWAVVSHRFTIVQFGIRELCSGPSLVTYKIGVSPCLDFVICWLKE